MPKLYCLTSALLLFMTSLASAQSSTAPDPTTPEGKRVEGRARYERGADAYSKGRFTDAIDLFLEADALAPSAALSFNIARAYEKIGDDASTLRWYRDFRRRAPEAKNGPEVDERIHVLEKALAAKGVQQLTVLTSPQGATVIVDDQPVGVSPFTGQFAPGKRRLVISLKGYADSAQDVELAADRAKDVNVPLVPETRVPGAPTPEGAVGPTSASGVAGPAGSSPAADHASGPRFGILPWIGLGAGALTLGGAGAFEMMRRSAEEDAKADKTQVGRKEELDKMHSRQTTARVLGAVGGALLVTGGVLLVLDLSTRSKTDGQSAALGLDCLTDECSVRAWGSF
jgi:hypothetical protein